MAKRDGSPSGYGWGSSKDVAGALDPSPVAPTSIPRAGIGRYALAVDPTHLTDAELEAELRMRAVDRDCDLVVERAGSHWRAEFKRFSDRGRIAEGCAPEMSAQAEIRRAALERLLWRAEERA